MEVMVQWPSSSFLTERAGAYEAPLRVGAHPAVDAGGDQALVHVVLAVLSLPTLIKLKKTKEEIHQHSQRALMGIAETNIMI